MCRPALTLLKGSLDRNSRKNFCNLQSFCYTLESDAGAPLDSLSPGHGGKGRREDRLPERRIKDSCRVRESSLDRLRKWVFI